MLTKTELTAAQLRLVEVCESIKPSQHSRAICMGNRAASAAGLALAAAVMEVHKGTRAEKTARAIRQHTTITAAVVNRDEGRVELRIEPRAFATANMPAHHIADNADPRALAVVLADLLS